MPTTSISRPSFSQHFVYFGNDEWAACPTVRAVVVGEKMSFSASAGDPPMISANAAKPITGACRELGIESLRRYEVGHSQADVTLLGSFQKTSLRCAKRNSRWQLIP